MNDINLHGIITDIQDSHVIDGVQFQRASLICKRDSGEEDIINLRFKSFSNKYKENDEIELRGNVRSYSCVNEDGKNKVTIYVFTYFDRQEGDTIETNNVSIDGRICKINELRRTRNGKHNLHFILANNLIAQDGGKRLNSYIPCIAWGNTAKKLAELSVNSKLKIYGELHSREHKKVYDNGEVELRVAHELLVNSFEVIE